MQTPGSLLSMGMHPNADPFEVFYRKHARWVLRRSALLVGGHNAEDVAQEVFFGASRAARRGDLDLSAAALGYLHQATRRAARDHLRRAIRERPADKDKEITPMDETVRGDPARALAVKEQWDDLLALLDNLSPKRRIVWVMAEIDEMTERDIAEELELPEGTVFTRLRLARADFEAALARKRAEDKRALSKAGALLLLPLNAEAIARTARSLPVPDVPDAAVERLWNRVQDRIKADEGRLPDDDESAPPTKRPPHAGPRLRSQGRDLAAISLGVGIGLIAALALGDAHGGRVTADPPREQIAEAVPMPEIEGSPAAVAGAAPASTASASSRPSLSSSSATVLGEQMLVASVQRALEPPDPDPDEALRLLDLYDHRYPHSRNFTALIEGLRKEALRLAEQRRQGR